MFSYRAGVAHRPLWVRKTGGFASSGSRSFTLHTIGSSGREGSSLSIWPTSSERALALAYCSPRRSRSTPTYSIPSSSITMLASTSPPVQKRNVLWGCQSAASEALSPTSSPASSRPKPDMSQPCTSPPELAKYRVFLKIAAELSMEISSSAMSSKSCSSHPGNTCTGSGDTDASPEVS